MERLAKVGKNRRRQRGSAGRGGSGEAACLDLKKQIAEGASFADLAKQQSSCPSGRRGGDLGTFGKGQIVPEFDKVVFGGEVGVVHGPAKRQFGYHLLEVTSRG